MDEHSPEAPTGAQEAKPKAERLNPSYSAGPAVPMAGKNTRNSGNGLEAEQDIPSIALGSTQSEKTTTTVSGNGRTIRLEGETEATFDGGSSQIVNQRVRRATGCENYEDDSCLRVTGTLVLTYHVTTTVTLPSVNDFPDLTDCQKRRVQDAIGNILAPHEQEHVEAFETYNGTTRHPFDLKVCNAEEASAALQEVHDSDAATREANAQTASDALDPFHFDVDLDCEDDTGESGGEPSSGTTPTEEPATPPAPQSRETEGEPEPEIEPETETELEREPESEPEIETAEERMP